MFLLVVDETTRFKWVYLMKMKSEATWHTKVLVNRLRVRFSQHHARHLHSDQGGEFLGGELAEFCGEQGLSSRWPIPIHLKKIIVERANGIALPRIRAMLTATHLLNFLWGRGAAARCDDPEPITDQAGGAGRTSQEGCGKMNLHLMT
ncbi:Retrotransposon protein, Ty1-Copia subclass [Phytophthora megakarya]|uniref:Retrotransposon protein, Ty1-Copia subclass n=1 Tax=Phytophthora megakarya TaxID=4795 RepID=A0A225WJZ9_9STRA|nr:Retrotransposon protein, Ty1-Copia subclass [Phytophthora megakarya]